MKSIVIGREGKGTGWEGKGREEIGKQMKGKEGK